jgi:hypothetical protein
VSTGRLERTESFNPVSAVTQPRMNDREVVRCECAFLLDRKERYRKARRTATLDKIHQRAKEQCS